MDDVSRYESSQEPFDDEERELMNEDNWDWDNPVETVIAANPLAVFPIKVTLEEHRVIAEAARDKGLTTSAFIKHAAITTARANRHRARQPVSSPRAATG